jgi:hypothetical protein
VMKFFAKHADLGIEFIATSLEALQIGQSLLDSL